MNCPHCGTQNEVNARFCAVCGSPLEGQPDQEINDNDRTIMSSVDRISEEAKTVAVSQDDLSALTDQMSQAEEAEFEPEPAPPSPSAPIGGSQGGSSKNTTLIIIVVVVLLLCCCCCAVAAILGYMSNNNFDLKDFSFLLPAATFLV